MAVGIGGVAYVSLYVDDVAVTRRFYADVLGLAVVEQGDWGLVLRAGSIDLFVHPRGDHARQHVEITFDVDDADAAIHALGRAGVRVVDEPADREWGDRDGAVEDPDGNTVYLRTGSEQPA
jgi:catechol 2,3-dioxygenase-like lactoylglutathione lyase family enzyme